VYTDYGSTDTLSGNRPDPANGNPTHFMASLRSGASLQHVVASLGVQWDVVKQLTVGAVVKSPGLRIGVSSGVTYESTQDLASGATSAFFQDPGQFDYKLPLEVSAGVGLRFSWLELEVDARFHDAVP